MTYKDAEMLMNSNEDVMGATKVRVTGVSFGINGEWRSSADDPSSTFRVEGKVFKDKSIRKG